MSLLDAIVILLVCGICFWWLELDMRKGEKR